MFIFIKLHPHFRLPFRLVQILTLRLPLAHLRHLITAWTAVTSWSLTVLICDHREEPLPTVTPVIGGNHACETHLYIGMCYTDDNG